MSDNNLSGLLDRAHEFVSNATQCLGNPDICICNDHILLRELAEYDARQPLPKGEFVLVRRDVIEFLCGSNELDGLWFGEKGNRPSFWWRSYLPPYRNVVAPPAPVAEPAQGVPVAWMLTDERLKALMEQVGMPNSRSLYQAFKQLENEVHHHYAAPPQPPNCPQCGTKLPQLQCDGCGLVIHPSARR